jgi:hypothetical protein
LNTLLLLERQQVPQHLQQQHLLQVVVVFYSLKWEKVLLAHLHHLVQVQVVEVVHLQVQVHHLHQVLV